MIQIMVSSNIAVLVSLILLSGCGRSPSPSAPSDPGKTPSPPVPPSPLVELRLVGPTTIEPGGLGTFAAMGRRANGTSEDVTSDATWTSSGCDATIESPGRVRVHACRGELVIAASIRRLSASQTVYILEPGTFRLTGVVREDTGRPLYGITVEITSGVGTGLKTVTPMDVAERDVGRFALYGAAGPITLKATGDGFRPQIDELVVNDFTTHDIVLSPLSTPADLSGEWRANLTAGPCRDNLPLEAWQRTYNALITQTGTRFQVTLRSPTIRNISNPTDPGTVGAFESTNGTIFDRALSFGITDAWANDSWWTPQLFDSLDSGGALGWHGWAEGTIAGSVITTKLSGTLGFWPGTSRTWPPPEICRAADHMLTFRKH